MFATPTRPHVWNRQLETAQYECSDDKLGAITTNLITLQLCMSPIERVSEDTCH